jgi:hypothetical protein
MKMLAADASFVVNGAASSMSFPLRWNFWHRVQECVLS